MRSLNVAASPTSPTPRYVGVTLDDIEMHMVIARANASTNQVFLNVNASSPSGVVEGALIDPEGIVMRRPDSGDEVLLWVLDLDRVTLARRFGSHCPNRPWDGLANRSRHLAFPMYAGATMVSPPWND